MKRSKTLSVLTAVLFVTSLFFGLMAGHYRRIAEPEQLPVRVLILPKFEIGEMSGDAPGQAQFYYDEYLKGGDVYEIEGATDEAVLYYKNGVAMCVTGEGKVA